MKSNTNMEALNRFMKEPIYSYIYWHYFEKFRSRAAIDSARKNSTVESKKFLERVYKALETEAELTIKSSRLFGAYD